MTVMQCKGHTLFGLNGMYLDFNENFTSSGIEESIRCCHRVTEFTMVPLFNWLVRDDTNNCAKVGNGLPLSLVRDPIAC